MRLKPDTVKALKRLSLNDDLSYWFDNMEKVDSLPENTEELIDEITTMLMHEYELPFKSHDKVKFFIRMGVLAGM